jgi:hypothetical protein
MFDGMACALCELPATSQNGRQKLCDKHYRFRQMPANAKRTGKAVPKMADLEAMSGATLICPDCGVKMNWKAKYGQTTVATLQHYRDGSMDIVCRSCNTRHAFMEGDSYRKMPKNCKQCPKCKEIKPSAEFTRDNRQSGVSKRKSRCRTCCNVSVKLWIEKNRDRHNERQRAYRAKRKAAGNPVLRKKPSLHHR